MAFDFNLFLEGCGVQPSSVRLLRHQSGPYNGRTPYTLWRDAPAQFAAYQSVQTAQNRSRLNAPYWANFVVTPSQHTLFVGLFEVECLGECDPSMIDPLRLVPVTQDGSRDLEFYSQRQVETCADYAGRIFVDWGPGTRTWIQQATNQPKPISKISRVFREDEFPGYGRFISNLSAIETLPGTWLSALQAAKGIYLLTCPNTKEQYVGSATGDGGFLARWLAYVHGGHGGNVGLKSRDSSDYQVSILEVSGSAAAEKDVLAAEQLWKAKLQSREMGLNRN